MKILTLSRSAVTICLVAIIHTSGCATIFTGTDQEIKFESKPEGVKVFLGGELKGETPITLIIRRDTFKNTTLRFEKEGYETQTEKLVKNFNKVTLLNLSSLSSWGTDVLSGAMIEYSPNNYYAEMKMSKETTSIKQQHEQLTRYFILSNYNHLLDNIASGGGKHLTGLFQLYQIPERSQAPLLTNLRNQYHILLNPQSPLQVINIINKALIKFI